MTHYEIRIDVYEVHLTAGGGYDTLKPAPSHLWYSTQRFPPHKFSRNAIIKALERVTRHLVGDFKAKGLM